MDAKELENKKVLELREFAKRYRVPKYSRLRKDELIAKILKKQSDEFKIKEKTAPKGVEEDTEAMLERTEAETRLKMKEAYSSPAIQRTYEAPPAEKPPEHRFYHPKDRFATPELPFEYYKDRVTLLVIDPNFFYCYWEVTKDKMASAQQVVGWDSKLTLRVYDVSDIHFNGQNAHSCHDIEVYERIGCWYIRLDKSNRDIVIDVGLKNSSGHFHFVARSNFAKLPPIHMAPEGPIKWMAVDDLGNYVITDIEEYTEADLLLLRRILGEDMFKRFMTGEFKGMLFSTVFKKIPNLKEITLDVPSSSLQGLPTSRSANP